MQGLYKYDVPRRSGRARRGRQKKAEKITEPVLPLDEIDGVNIETDQISAGMSPGLNLSVLTNHKKVLANREQVYSVIPDHK